MFKFTGTKAELDKFLKTNFTAKGIAKLQFTCEIALVETVPTVLCPAFSADELALASKEKLVQALQVALPLKDSKIQAIKAVREVTNMGLKEAKDFVEKYLPPPSPVFPLAQG